MRARARCLRSRLRDDMNGWIYYVYPRSYLLAEPIPLYPPFLVHSVHVDVGSEGWYKVGCMAGVKGRSGRPSRAKIAEMLAKDEQKSLEMQVAGDRLLEQYYAICAYEAQGMEIWEAYKKVRNLRDEANCRKKAKDLLEDEIFCKIRERFLEVRARDLESIKTEITAMHLGIMRNESLPTKDRVMAARELSEMCGFKTQKMEVVVDSVQEYAKLHLERTRSEPLVLESSGDGEIIDV